MDTFSLSLSIGTLFNNINKCMLMSSVVGLFHFFMPLMGWLLGFTFINIFNVNSKLLSSIIFLYIAYGMFRDFKSKEETKFSISLSSMLLFSFGVSLDSFGIGFTFDSNFYLNAIYSMLFAVFAFIFTFVGLRLGSRLKEKIGSYAVLIGAVIMVFLSLINIINI